MITALLAASAIAIHQEGARTLIYDGPYIIASNDPSETETARLWACSINDRRGKQRVAMLGLGCGNLLAFLDAEHDVTVYELHREIVEWWRSTNARKRTKFVVGDYREMLCGTYDVIVDDTGVDYDFDFALYLRPGGIVLSWRDTQ